MNFLEKISKEKVTQWRRHFHMYPELGFCEHETTKYIVEELGAYPGVEILRPTPTGLVAVLDTGKPGPVIGLRADIDALPILEEADVPYKSKNDGVMHACGHDCHTAMLLGAIDVLHRQKDDLKGKIKFIFQQAEEVPPGWASHLCKSGALDDVQIFYGCHIFLNEPAGTVTSVSGPLFANTDNFEIFVQGKGTHAARPEKGIDSLLIGTEIVQAINYIVPRQVSAGKKAVITVGAFNSGNIHNVVPDTAEIKGTVRTYDQDVRNMIEARIKAMADGICQAYGATCKVEHGGGYDSVVNTENLNQFFRKTAKKYIPDINITEMEALMGGEDFSEYGKLAPSHFVGIGAKPKEGERYGGHHPKFVVDEDCLPIGTALYAAFALEVMESGLPT